MTNYFLLVLLTTTLIVVGGNIVLFVKHGNIEAGVYASLTWLWLFGVWFVELAGLFK